MYNWYKFSENIWYSNSRKKKKNIISEKYIVIISSLKGVNASKNLYKIWRTKRNFFRSFWLFPKLKKNVTKKEKQSL